MRWLVNYFRQVLCKHEFEYSEHQCCDYITDNLTTREGIKVSLICKKCGYHKSFWKF